MPIYNFDYHYGYGADQFSFYRIPKALFTNGIFKVLSCEAKVLYGLMLDRMGLSMKNRWIDEYNRVYIYFKLEDVTEALCCGKEKGIKLLAELDDVKGIGLIERKKQGMGRPARIYVKNFIICEGNADSTENDNGYTHEVGKSEVIRLENQKSLLPETRSHEVGKSEVMRSENQKSLLPEIGSHEVGKSNSNNTNINDTDINKNQSINQENQSSAKIHQNEAYETYRQIIKDNISYDTLIHDNYSKNHLDEIVELMLESICANKKYLRINSENVPAELVKSRLLKLDFTHIEYVIDCLSKNTSKVNNIRNYMLTALYNSYTSIQHYYQSEVSYEFYGKT